MTWALARDPYLANVAVPPPANGLVDTWIASTDKRDENTPALRLYYKFDDDVLTLVGLEVL